MTQTHCAKFSKALFEPIREVIAALPEMHDGYPQTVYDPMAGVGTLEEILEPWPDLVPVGSEIEPEYAAAKPWIVARDCLACFEQFSLIITSPPYDNRMHDQYLGTPGERAARALTGKKPRRNGYAIDLGRRVTEGSAAGVRGDDYRKLMSRIWGHVVDNNMDGYLIVNVGSNFVTKRIRTEGKQGTDTATVYNPVAEWTLETLTGLGLVCVSACFVETPGLRDGQNRSARVGGEMVYLFKKETN